MCPDDIIKAACKFFNINHHLVLSRDRRRDLSETRFMLFHVLYYNPWLNLTMEEIGVFFRRHHTAVLHGINKAHDYSKVDLIFRNKLTNLHLFIYKTDKFLILPMENNIKQPIL